MKFFKKNLYIIIIFILSILILYVAFYRHRPERISFWENEIYCDKGGYYVYLPATFLYSFNAEKFPDYAEEKTGFGFRIIEGKIVTKYPYGTSLLMAPFFLATHLIATLSGVNADGFSAMYLKMTLVSGVFYLFLGLLFLYRFLRHYFDPLTTYLTLIFLLFGTNLYFYSTDEAGMSHVYSFALFSMLLYVNKRFLLSDGKPQRFRLFIAICVLCSLIVIVRNIDIVFLPFVFLWDLPKFSAIKERILLYLTWKNLTVLLCCAGLFIIPQMIYWKYAFGSYFQYSYGIETFDHLRDPKWLELLFSPRSGMLLYNPLILFMILGAVVLLIKKNLNGGWMLLMLVAYVYLYASWFTWSLGSSYGSRAVVDIFPFLAVGLALIISLFKRIYKMAIITVMMLICLLNLNIISGFRVCISSFSDWDWYQYNYSVSSGDIVVFFKGPNYYQEAPDYIITIKSNNGKYIRLQPDGSLRANGVSVTKFEKFKLINVDQKKQQVALKADNSYYVCSNGNKENQLWSVSEKRLGWESFFLIREANGKMAIKNCNDRYVSADPSRNDLIIADRTEANEWELFSIDTLDRNE